MMTASSDVLAIEVGLGAGGVARTQAFLESLRRLVAAGTFDPRRDGGPVLAGAPTLSATARGLRLELPVAHAAAVSQESLRQLFQLIEPDEPVPLALLALEGPPDSPGAETLAARSEAWRQLGRVEALPFWPETGWTLEVEFPAELSPEARRHWEQLLEDFERVVAEAPFIAGDPDALSAMGECQILWIGPSRLQFWTSGVASAAPWSAMLLQLLFSGALIAPAAHARLLA
ncbi:hypothetical protein ACQ859_17515 [Roseateles chitinivorans]|uniref:hypothetical protein n=1 Tax=Roseateles chitinivorans TaxID=2917965 RepID=UPI003D67193C